MTKIIASAAALALATIATPAIADDELASVSVQFGDLDLTNADDLKRLENRFSHAINWVCGGSHARARGQYKVARKCKAALHTQANETIASLQQNSVRFAKAITFKVES